MNRLTENIGTCYKSRPPQNRHISPRLGEKGFRFPPHGAIPEAISKIKHIAFSGKYVIGISEVNK